jgi:hypothetical protein
MTLRQLEILLKPLREFSAYTVQPWTDTITEEFIPSLQMPSRHLKGLKKRNIIFDKKIIPAAYSNRRDFVFYSFKENETFTYKEIDHRAMIADLALAFNYHYPGCSIEYEKLVKAEKTDIRADMVVTFDKYKWIVELERSLTPLQIKDIKMKRYERLTEKAKVLFVYAPREYPFSLRPMQYKDHPVIIGRSKEGVEKLTGYFDQPYYLAMSFHNFHKLNKAVWYNPKGEKCQLIY